MAIVSKNMTYEHTPIQVGRSYYGAEGHPEASAAGSEISGTLTTTAATNDATVSYNDRWEVMEYSNAANDMAVWNHWLPYSARPDLGVSVDVKWTSNATTGNFVIVAGLCSMTTASVYGLETDTRYYRNTVTAPSVAGNLQTLTITETETISGSAFLPNRNIAFVLVREGGAAADTSTGTFDVLTVTFKWYENQEGNLTI